MRLQGKSPSQSSAVDSPKVTPPPSPDANPCQPLGDYLQQRWDEEAGNSTIQLHCFPQSNEPQDDAPQGQLLGVAVEHAITEQPPVKATFERITILLEEAPECLWLDWLGEDEDLPEIINATLSIGVLGQTSSYVTQQSIINLMAGVAPGMMPLASEASFTAAAMRLSTPDSASATGQAGAEQTEATLPATNAQAGATSPNQYSPEQQPANPLSSPISPASNATALVLSSHSHSDEQQDDALPNSEEAGQTPERDEPVSSSDLPPEAEASESKPEREAPLEPAEFHIPKQIWAGGLGLCVAMFLGSFYVASRPCLLRDCPALTLAERQGQAATERLQVANNLEDIQQSRQQFNLALKQLRKVPSWSSYGAEARGARSRYDKILGSLSPVEDALDQANLAEEKTQLETAKPERWQEIQAHWETAIAHLQSVSPKSPLYALAQDKLKTYQAAKVEAQVRLVNEREGQQLLKEARGYMAAASAASGSSDSDDPLEQLQRSEARLEDAIFTLKQIPRGTAAYQESVRLLSSYQAELAINQGQQSQEAFILDSYREALLYAEDAKRAEEQDRWRDAEEYWQIALDRIERIPAQSPYFNKAQSLGTEYHYALRIAEQRSEEQLVLTQLESELDLLCAGSPKVCTYEVTPTSIQVQLTLDYERAVLTAGAIGDENSRAGALQHVQELESALEASSNAAQIPLELYDPDGVLVGTHQPRVGYGEI